MEDVGVVYSHLVYLRLFGIVCGHLAKFVAIWYILWLISHVFSRFGTLYQEKSGNPAPDVG
jgi:hypothetical protein